MHYHTGALNEGEDDTVLQHYCNIGREGGPGSSGGVNNGELPQNEQVITSLRSTVLGCFFVFVTVNTRFGDFRSKTVLNN